MYESTDFPAFAQGLSTSPRVRGQVVVLVAFCGEAQCVVNTGVGRGNRLASKRGDELHCQCEA